MTGEAMGLQALHFSKTFGGHRALDDVSLTLRKGEIHGLLGQNGCGKSTFIKILAGYHAPDPGAELILGGQPVSLPLPSGRSQALGISIVHQHLGVIPSLSVVENLELSQLSASRELAISWRAKRDKAAATFARYGLDIDPALPLSRLAAVERAMVAIIRAVEDLRSSGRDGGVLILDEPTPFLPKRDVQKLFELVRQIAATGAGVLFVSHDIDEVQEITDRATILRDGRNTGTVDTRDCSRQQIIELIVGRKLTQTSAASVLPAGAPGLASIRRLTGGGVEALDLDLKAGEIVGMTGLIGSGFEQVNYLLYGALPARAGSLTLGGATSEIPAHDPAASIRAGMVLIPGDRNEKAAIGVLPIEDNVTMPVLGSRLNRWNVRRAAMRKLALELGETFGVAPNRPHQPLSSLSGGNAQKVVLAKWLQTGPKLILLDEPTQGVDVGARERVFDAIRKSTDGGAAVICASSDYEQLAALCHRVLIFSGGRVVRTLQGADVSKDEIARACLESPSLLRAAS
jgi:ribose transport system ATP-binding protein